MFYTDLNLM